MSSKDLSGPEVAAWSGPAPSSSRPKVEALDRQKDADDHSGSGGRDQARRRQLWARWRKVSSRDDNSGGRWGVGLGQGFLGVRVGFGLWVRFGWSGSARVRIGS